MTFAGAVAATTELRGSLKSGLKGMRAADRVRIRKRPPTILSGSVDVDGACSAAHPNEPRWDYALGWRTRKQAVEKVSWIEVHPATPAGTDEVLHKLAWLRRWLRQSAPALDAMDREFVWISSGRVSPNLTSAIRPKLAQQGLKLAGRVHRVG